MERCTQKKGSNTAQIKQGRRERRQDDRGHFSPLSSGIFIEMKNSSVCKATPKAFWKPYAERQEAKKTRSLQEKTEPYQASPHQTFPDA